MAKCQDITPTIKKICIGSLRQKIKIKTRNLQGPVNFGEGAHIEEFTTFKTVSASFETKNAGAFRTLDGVAQDPESVITHVFIIRFIANVNAQQFVEFQSINYKILKVINIDLRNRWLKLNCNERGDASKAGAQ